MPRTAHAAIPPCLTIALWLAGLCLPAVTMAAESAAEQELLQLNAAIERLQSWLAAAQQNRPEVESRLQAAESRLATLTLELDQIRSALDEGNQRLGALRQQQQALEADHEQQTAQIRQLVRSAYMEGEQGTIKLLLNQQDPAMAARALYYYRRINDARLARVNQYRDTLAGLAVTAQELEQARVELARQQDLLDQRRAELELERQARHQALEELDTAIAQRGGELDRLVADRAALEALVEEVRQAMETVPVPGGQDPFTQRRGQLPWPVAGELLNTFGERYGNGDLQRQGIVIGSKTGSPVRAVHSGRVVFADWLRGSGLLIIVDHGDGYMSLYGHNETLTREQGARVEAGAVIATAGNSGGNRRSGVYFEIRHNGRPQNPADWLTPEG